ncbi:hypothetical protein CCP1ISM_3780002 [Azospirillaceae bacterium]
MKHIEVPYAALETYEEQLLYRGVSKEFLQNLPDAVLTDRDRVSKVIAAVVVNGAGETMGAVDDLIMTTDRTLPFAVLSVGGFLGMGKKLVVVPFRALEGHAGQMLIVNGTKDSISNLPEFSYNN